ncbi:MAG: phosphocholine cytidylyltransferase family protein [Gammaproteobacteria bacterium]|nr:phosphocholine cytidylyltransferase family protein [Gammaproteobacteria bacterium]
MRVLIMAAGVGSRISRHLHGQPKCCVDVAGTPLIRRTVEQFIRKGISQIAVVTGYQEKFVINALEGLPYARYFNPFYRIANSISSVWFARDFLATGEKVLIMNGDVFFDDSVMTEILAEDRSPTMLSDSTRIEDADYRFQWQDDLLIRYGKELSNEETTGEYVGIGLLEGESLISFRQQMLESIATEDYGCWWEEIIYRTVDRGEQVFVRDIAGKFWAEVDYIEDYMRIQEYLKH